jgi:hypothetical protein
VPASFHADLRGDQAFNFHVPATNTRFTIHAPNKDSYQIGDTYALILAAPEALPLPLSVEDIEFLRHCLTNTAQRWHEAIAHAEAGAEHAQPDHPPPPGFVNAEPTPGGYQTAGRLFREQLARVEQLNARLGEFLRAGEPGTKGDQP